MTATTRKPADATDAKAPAPTPCRCGCGRPTVRPEAAYVSGHDAAHAGRVGKDLAARKVTEDDVRKTFADRPKLAAKAIGVAETAARKAAEKAAASAAREAAKAAAKVAYEAALAK